MPANPVPSVSGSDTVDSAGQNPGISRLFHEEPDSGRGRAGSPLPSMADAGFVFAENVSGFALGPGDVRRNRSGRLSRAHFAGALAAAGMVGAALIGVHEFTRVAATAQASLPYSASTALPNAGLAGLPSGVSAVRVAAPNGAAAVYEFRAVAPTAGRAISQVDAAAQTAVRENAAAWARAAQSSAGDFPDRTSVALAAMPLARMISSGDKNPLRSQTTVRFDMRRAPPAAAWLGLFAAAAALCALVRPKPRPQFVFRRAGRIGSAAASSRRATRTSNLKSCRRGKDARTGKEPPRITDLPQMASVHLARDVSGASDFERMPLHAARQPGSDLRPVLSNASEKLWMNFASRADLASAMSAAAASHDDEQSSLGAAAAGTELSAYNDAAQAILEQAQAAPELGGNTEILFTRLTRDARGSRAAMLAIARLLAQRGKKVVLVDLDFAAPQEALAELGLPCDFPGAAEILSRRAKVDDCLLMDDDYPALTALAACLEGTEISREQAARLLQSAEMLDLLDELREGNQLVLIHGPAAEDAARSLGSRADAALLVVGREPTECEHRALPDALAEMNAVQANIVGRIDFHGRIA